MANSVQHMKVIEDPQRLEALHKLDLLDTAPELAFDRLTKFASKFIDAPVALMSLIDSDRQFFKSQVGLSAPWDSKRETPLSHSFCQYIVSSAAALIVEDARLDPSLRDNLAIPDLKIVAYAGTPLRTSDGYMVGSFCVTDSKPRAWTAEELELLRDIAAIAATEIELRRMIRLHQEILTKSIENEQRYELLFNNSMDAIMLTNPDGLILMANPAACKMFGYSEESLKSLGRGAIIDSTDPRLASALETRNQTGRFRGELRMLHANGTSFDVELSSNIYHSADGPRTSMIIRDISTRERIEAALRESEDRYRSVITAMAEGITLQDADSRILATNESAKRILGLSADQMMNMTSTDPGWRAIHEDGTPFPGETHPSITTLQSGLVQSNVIMGVHKPNGELTWISINSQPLFNPGETKPHAAVTSFSDITQRIAFEAALSEHIDQLDTLRQLDGGLTASLDIDYALGTSLAESIRLRAYPNNPAARKAMSAHEKCRKAK